MTKQFIQNRHDQKVSVLLEGPETASKLAFVMHGLGGNKGELHLRAVIDAFLKDSYMVVSFDTTNSFGESDGQYEDATLTGYYHDLEDVIAWASKQPWYAEPFVLAGHSFGGIVTSLFAENYPEKVKALAPISSVISGELTLQTPQYAPDILAKWKRDGVLVLKRQHGGEKRLKWACMEDRLKYSLLPSTNRLTMPVLLVTGSEDQGVPPKHQQILYDKLPGPKEMHVIKGASHMFDEVHERDELETIVKTWAGKL